MAEGTHRPIEQRLGRGVVEVDCPFVGHFDLQSAERVARPRRLANQARAVDLPHLIAGGAPHRRSDALRHVPPGIDGDGGDARGKLRGRGPPRADDAAMARHHPPILDERDGEGRDVDDDVPGAEIARHPAPALHIGADDVAAGDIVGRGVGKRLLEPEILRMGGQQRVQRRGDVALARADQHRLLARGIDRVHRHVPVDT